MSFDVTRTSPEDWKYVSEGGSMIVFSYFGPASRDLDGMVLRVRKASRITGEATLPVLQDDTDEPDDPTIVFQHRIIEHLLPAEHLPRLESVRVSQQWLEQLRDLSEGLRPEERRNTDTIDVTKRKAVLATDLVGAPGFSVEIKPKWGFLPPPTHLSSRSKLVKTTTCRFCMHAHLKSTDGEDVALGYCPLDLYSGEEKRVTKAIHALWDAWIGTSGGVNNLRVFVGGSLLRPSAFPVSLSPLARQLFRPENTEPSLDNLRDAFTASLLRPLLQSPILQKLSHLQRTLDALDIEGLSALWNTAQSTANVQLETALGAAPGQMLHVRPLGQGLLDPPIADWVAFLDVYLSKHEAMAHDHPDAANLHYYCLAYLLSASFKDCSVIIRAVPDAAPSIYVIDLDVKPIERLQKWAALDAEIVQAYEGIAGPTRCVDRWSSQASH